MHLQPGFYEAASILLHAWSMSSYRGLIKNLKPFYLKQHLLLAFFWGDECLVNRHPEQTILKRDPSPLDISNALVLVCVLLHLVFKLRLVHQMVRIEQLVAFLDQALDLLLRLLLWQFLHQSIHFDGISSLELVHLADVVNESFISCLSTSLMLRCFMLRTSLEVRS